MRVYLNGIGLIAPGLCGWENSQKVLRGTIPFDKNQIPDPIPSVLKPNELRRSSEIVRWALHTAQEAIEHSHLKPQEVETVFASSGGESEILHQIGLRLSTPELAISPTLFHHSVHNAAAGYWSIGVESQQPSTSLAAYDSSFIAGLLEAMTVCCSHHTPTLLVAYDLQPPYPLFAARPLSVPFGVAFVMSPRPLHQSFSFIEAQLIQDSSPQSTPMDSAELESLRVGNPAGRALPILWAIANGTETPLDLEFLEDQLVRIEVHPCLPYPE